MNNRSISIDNARLKKNNTRLKEEIALLDRDAEKLACLLKEFDSCWSGRAKDEFLRSLEKSLVSLDGVCRYCKTVYGDLEYALEMYDRAGQEALGIISAVK